jgi:hypothetical protein
LLLTVMKACSGPVTGGLEGAWQSNRDLTLAELRQAQSFTPDQRRALSDPTLFGHIATAPVRARAARAVSESQVFPKMTRAPVA